MAWKLRQWRGCAASTRSEEFRVMTEVGGISLGRSGKLYFNTSLSQNLLPSKWLSVKICCLKFTSLLYVIAEELIVAQDYFELTVCQVCCKVKQFARVKSGTWRVKFQYCWVHAVEQTSPNKVSPLTIDVLYALGARATKKQSEVWRTMTDELTVGTLPEERWLMSCWWVRCLKNDDWSVLSRRRKLFQTNSYTTSWGRQTTPSQSSSTKLCTRTVKYKAKGVASRDQVEAKIKEYKIALNLS